MVEESAVARHGEARVSTGNASLDAMLEGGLVARRPYLVVGPSGTGKTTLAIQFLCDGVRRGEHVLLVTLEEPPNEARVNHRGLEPALDRVEVFDAIPDIMRYERTPFKDIASVRSAVPFGKVPLEIRRSPELASVEVTITALEQMLRTEVTRKNYTRLVIDSLTALQYFCMKGYDPVAGAQSFLRFLSDLRVTTILTVEAPLEDVETPERMLARGEIRLFRWELDGQTVRAVGVEKFRGSSHDVRLHPYRIGPQGIDINLEVTISRDTRQIIEPIVRPSAAPMVAAPVSPIVSSVTPLMEEVRDLILLGADVEPARSEIEAALAATVAGQLDEAQAHLSRMSSLVVGLVDTLGQRPGPPLPEEPGSAAALQRVLARADTVRTGVPPTSLPPQAVLQVQLGALLSLLPAPTLTPAPTPSPAPTLTPAPASSPTKTEEVAPAPEVPAVAPPPATVPSPEPETPVPPSTATERIPALVADLPAPAAAEPPTFRPEPGPPPAEPTPAPPESSAPTLEIPPSPEAPPPLAESPPPEVTTRAKPLPSPPKPRPSLAGPRTPKAAPSTPPPRRASKKEEPPPLPTATMPGWLTSSAPADAPKLPSTGTGPSASSPPAHPRLPATPEVPPAARKRRKPSVSATGRKTAPTARVTGHLPISPAPPAQAAPPVDSSPSVPPVVAPGLPSGAVPSPKPRRRSARKRKAPPVVAAEVEPVPPEDLASRDEETPGREESGPSSPPEG